MKYKHILAIDPSGNWHEGSGTTGWVIINYKQKLIATGQINAKDYKCPEDYWNDHVKLIERNQLHYGDSLIVVIEDYRLYAGRASNQINSQMETCRLLGVLQWTCWKLKQPYSLQLASSVKNRWNDDLLVHEHILTRTHQGLVHTDSGKSLKVVHIRDAFRHAIHYAVCRNGNKSTYKRYKKGAFNNVRSNY